MHIFFNKKFLKNIKVIAVASILTLTLSSCSLFRRDVPTDVVDNSVVVVNNINDLSEDTFYVGKQNGKFYRLYMGAGSFVPQRGSNSTKPTNVLWFKEDYDKIPTMKQGDFIVYHSNSLLKQNLAVNRLYDLGYTIGIAKLKKQENQDHYYFSAVPDSLNVMTTSSAAQTLELNSEKVVLDKMGETPIRSGNVSQSGTVKGLTKDSIYKVWIYRGTKAHQYNIIADTRAFGMAEKDTLSKYEFHGENTVRFQFPAYYNPGYYMIDGFGLVRYIKDNEKFSDDIDMNIPNVYPTKQEIENGLDIYDNTAYVDTSDVTTQTFNVLEDGEYYINVDYNNSEDEEKGYKVPTVKLVGPDRSIPVPHVKDGLFELKIELNAGDYEIQIIGLHGRTYTYKAVPSNTLDSEKEGTSKSENDNNNQDKKPTMADLVKENN